MTDIGREPRAHWLRRIFSRGQASSYLIITSRRRSRLSKALPEPSTTVESGSSVMVIGRPVCSLSSTLSPFQQGAAACEHNTPIHDIGGKLRRGSAQGQS
jgi:hypothetical protein